MITRSTYYLSHHHVVLLVTPVSADRIREDANLQSNDSDGTPPHSSYRYHRESDPRLEISIELSPDCTACIATTQQSSAGANDNDDDANDNNNHAVAGSNKKRPIIDTTNSHVGDGNSTEASPNAKRQKPSVSFADQSDEYASTATASSTHVENKMEIKDILSSLRKALPHLMESNTAGDNNSTQSFSRNDGYLAQPFGHVLTEYKRTVHGNSDADERDSDAKRNDVEADFVITLADGSDQAVADYHAKVQGLAMFFIETADNVDLSSNEGHWKCLYVYRRHEADQYSLVGYTTLFHFNSPFRKPNPGIVMRVCQAIVLPPYQRGGHGSMMLHEVYKIAEGRTCTSIGSNVDESTTKASDGDVVEVNVEDPCPGFVALRNKVDFKRFQNSSDLGRLQSISTKVHSNDFCSPLPEDLVAAGAAKLRVTPQQIHIASEMAKLNAMEAEISALRSPKEISCNEETIEGMVKKYRLMVKKRLLKIHREELGACRSKDEQKAKLGEIFDNTLLHYRSLLKLK